jgi:hypothetical protein
MARPKKSKDGISKMEAVRQALAKHGRDTKPGRAGASDFDQIIGGGLIWSSRGAYDSPRTDRVHGGE